MQKILGVSTEAQDFLTVLRSRWQRTGANRLSLLKILFLFRGQETARFENGGQPAVTLEKSEVLRLLLENLRFFSHPASMQGVKKKGRV